jgi:hypothetical protein
VNDDDIAHRLAAAGDRWRAGQPEPPAPEVTRFSDGTRLRSPEHSRPRGGRRVGRSVALATIGVAAAVLVAVGVPQVLQRWSADGGSVPGTPTAPASASSVDRAQGRLAGQLFRDASGAVYRCANESKIINFPPTFSCDEPRQRVEGVPETAFVYWLPNGQEYSASATLTGTARSDGVFVASSVTLDLARLGRALGPPCGSHPTPQHLSEAEVAELRLRQPKVAEFVYAHPDRYGASWVAADGAMVVVGTTGDLSAAQALFEAAYPKQHLCVYHAEYSYTQLAEYASRFAAGGFYAGIDRVHNRVLVVGESTAEQRLIEQIEPGAFTTSS